MVGQPKNPETTRHKRRMVKVPSASKRPKITRDEIVVLTSMVTVSFSFSFFSLSLSLSFSARRLVSAGPSVSICVAGVEVEDVVALGCTGIAEEDSLLSRSPS